MLLTLKTHFKPHYSNRIVRVTVYVFEKGNQKNMTLANTLAYLAVASIMKEKKVLFE